jgi:3-oxoacyl-[acyl-carrier protein] reductase
MNNIENYIVVIAGASGGIGSAIISSLSEQVSTIICLNRKHEKISISKNTKIIYIKTDLDRFENWEKVVNRIIKEFKKIDVFINCIGKTITGSLNNQQIDEIEKLFSVNLMLHIYGLKAIIPVMQQQQNGHIIEIGSLGGLVPMPFVSTYSASKFALRGLVLSIREELKNTGVIVSLLNPGSVDTQMLYKESDNPEAVISFAENIISPETVAESVFYLINHHKAEMTIPVSNGCLALIINHYPNLFHWIYPILNYIGSKRRKSYRVKFSGGLS